MLRRKSTKFVVLASVLSVFAGFTAVAMGSSNHRSAALKWTKGANQAWAASSPKTTFVSSVVTITCKKNTAGGSTVGSGPDIGFLAMNAPTFKSCTDSLGGTDTVTPKTTGWKVAFYWDKTNAHCPSGTGGGKALHCVVLTVPKDADTIKLNSLGCTLTVQPSGPTDVGATAKAPGGTTKDTFTLTNQSVAYSGCATSGTAKFSGTYTLSKPNGGVLVAGSS
jgi:hypothetical protein